MARIRSVHPGLWTDEIFVSLSPFARLLSIGIWNECDDMGSFEWSPLKLKMRLLPADTADAALLLEELEAAGQVMRYEHEGKRYGAVRNFCQYQRPKSATSVHPQTEEVRKWVNVNARTTRDGGETAPPSAKANGGTKRVKLGVNGEAVGKSLPSDGEKSRQRKEGGDSSVTDVTGAAAPPVDPVKVLFDAGVALLTSAGLSNKSARALIARWRNAHGDTATSAAILSAAGKTEPVPWIEARFKKIDASDDDVRAASRATAERYRKMDMPGPPVDQLEGVH